MLSLFFGGLFGCAEALRTDRAVVLQPSPSLPGGAPLIVPSPAATTAGSEIPPLEETAVASPAQEAQLPTTPVIGTTAAGVPTAPPALLEATPAPTIVPPTLPALSNEQKWRAQQQNRQAFDAPQTYTTTGSQLWWYDPIHQQHVILGNITGEFVAQARFELAGQGVEALEVPYEINQRYGLTALSPALVQRLSAAGYDQWVETYVIAGPGVQLQ